MNTTGAIGISISGSLMAKPVLSNMSLMGKEGAGAAYPDLAPVSAVAFIVGIVLVVLFRGKLYGSRTDRGPNDELLPPLCFSREWFRLRPTEIPEAGSGRDLRLSYSRLGRSPTVVRQRMRRESR